MKATKMVILVIAIIALALPSLSCLSDDVTASSLVPRITATEATTAKHETRITALETNRVSKAEMDATLANAKAYTDTKFTAVTTANSYTKSETYTKSEVDAAITTAIQNYKNSLSAGTTSTGQTINTATGTISYTVQNPAPLGLYQLSSASNISIRIFNNKGEARYVRPQITLTSYQGANNGAVTPTATVISNSMGQNPIIFSANPIPVGATTQVLFIAASGGVQNGQYLVPSGANMDLLITVTAAGSLNSLWNMSVTGSDVSAITGY
jgi:hypothetical protein